MFLSPHRATQLRVPEIPSPLTGLQSLSVATRLIARRNALELLNIAFLNLAHFLFPLE